jgi:predicted RNA-binding Zn ribbon-like protein
MTGSCQCLATVDRYDAGEQPAGRPPAPGRLAYVQAFLNTFWDLDRHGGDVWSSPAAYGAWLTARGFEGPPTTTDLDRAIGLRATLRDLCLANHDGGDNSHDALVTLDALAGAVAPAAALAPSLTSGTFEPLGDGPDAACALALAIVLQTRQDGTFARLKACPHANCGWAFYDTSRNRSSQWCSMRICGNRTKGETFRRRAREHH